MSTRLRQIYIRLSLVALLALATPLLMASHTNIVGIYANALWSAAVLPGSATTNSNAATEVGRAEHLSVQYRCASAGNTHDVTLKVKTSLDEVNYATPDTGGTVNANITDGAWHHAILAIPVSKAIKFSGTTNNATATTVDVILGNQ